jgi:hypothetical protein
MDIIKEVNDLLTAQGYYERMGKLSMLADRFEDRHDLNREEVIEGVKLLLVPALQEQDKNVKGDFFDAIHAAVVHQDIGDCVNWDMLVEALPSLKKGLLGYALNILGLSGQEKYLSIMHTYAQDSDSDIQEWAEEGIQEITYRLAHRDDAPNKEE